MLWITADWHLGEDRFELMGRPFTTAEEHIEALIANHNALVKPEDEVIVVGDAIYQKSPESHVHISRFNGVKTLLRGNHDRPIDDATYSKYFQRILPEGEGLEMVFCGISCWLTHYPTCGVSDKFNLVGHIHSAWKYQLNMFNVGVDVNHFRPVSADRIFFHFDAIDKYYDNDVWVAYNDINCQHRGKRGRQSTYFSK
jgi:calcineurin-like phosphoesterase family protein